MVYFINKVIKTNNNSTNDKSVKQKHAPARMYVSAWVSAEANFVDLCQWIQYKRIHITCSFLCFHSKTKKNARKLISLQSECYGSYFDIIKSCRSFFPLRAVFFLYSQLLSQKRCDFFAFLARFSLYRLKFCFVSIHLM